MNSQNKDNLENADSQILETRMLEKGVMKGIKNLDNFEQSEGSSLLHKEKGNVNERKLISDENFTKIEINSSRIEDNFKNVRYVECENLATNVQMLSESTIPIQAIDGVKKYLHTRKIDYIAPGPLCLMAEFCKETSKCSIKLEIVKTVDYETHKKYETTESVLKKAKPSEFIGVIQMWRLNGSAFLAEDLFTDILFDSNWTSKQEEDDEGPLFDSEDEESLSDSGLEIDLRFLILTTNLIKFWLSTLKSSFIIPEVENVLTLMLWNITGDNTKKITQVEKNRKAVCKFAPQIKEYLITLIGNPESTLIQVRKSLELLQIFMRHNDYVELKQGDVQKLMKCLKTWSGSMNNKYWIGISRNIQLISSGILAENSSKGVDKKDIQEVDKALNKCKLTDLETKDNFKKFSSRC